MSSKEREFAHTTQEKFNFYLISLVFTLLALSIQTAEFGNYIFSDFAELLGWACLLVSGVVGLSRIEYLPVERVKLAQKTEYEDRAIQAKELQLKGERELHVIQTGQKQSLDERIANSENAIEILNPLIQKLQYENGVKYMIHRYTFIIGISLIVVSRSFSPLIDIYSRVSNG
ncbi:MAG: hypothetical protein RQ732_03785 [Methylophaga sp.]|nr:hypothetical protein [Methylophaga sp.]